MTTPSSLSALIDVLEQKKKQVDALEVIGEGCPELRQYASALVENGSTLLALSRWACDAQKKFEKLDYHRGCEDGFYACPKSEDYFGEYEDKPIELRPCECHKVIVDNALNSFPLPHAQ